LGYKITKFGLEIFGLAKEGNSRLIRILLWQRWGIWQFWNSFNQRTKCA